MHVEAQEKMNKKDAGDKIYLLFIRVLVIRTKKKHGKNQRFESRLVLASFGVMTKTAGKIDCTTQFYFYKYKQFI